MGWGIVIFVRRILLAAFFAACGQGILIFLADLETYPAQWIAHSLGYIVSAEWTRWMLVGLFGVTMTVLLEFFLRRIRSPRVVSEQSKDHPQTADSDIDQKASPPAGLSRIWPPTTADQNHQIRDVLTAAGARSGRIIYQDDLCCADLAESLAQCLRTLGWQVSVSDNAFWKPSPGFEIRADKSTANSLAHAFERAFGASVIAKIEFTPPDNQDDFTILIGRRPLPSESVANASEPPQNLSIRDWNPQEAFHWWRGAYKSVDHDEFFRELRQKARDGAITIWGRPPNRVVPIFDELDGPFEEIPRRHWRDNDLDVIRYVFGDTDDCVRNATSPPENEESEGTRYRDLRVTSLEIMACTWPGEEA